LTSFSRHDSFAADCSIDCGEAVSTACSLGRYSF
jgi:hypothetical protein